MDTESKAGSVGPIVASVIVLAAIILGAIYFWGQRSNNYADDAAVTAQNDTIDIQSSSDDTNSIEADLNNTDTTNIGAELESM